MDRPFAVTTVNTFTVVEFLTSSLMNPPDLERIGEALNVLVEEKATGLLVLDFTKVEYLSSQAIGIVVALHKRVTKFPGGRLVLCGVGPQLTQLLKITRLDRLLKITKNQKDAVSTKT